MAKDPRKKKSEVRVTLSLEDIEVTAGGNIKIKRKEVADKLKIMMAAAKAQAVSAKAKPTAIRVSA